MNYSGLTRFICLLLLCGWSNAGDLPIENKKDIEKHQQLLKETVKEDLTEMKNKHNELVKLINKSLLGIRGYVQDSIEDLKTHLKEEMKTSDALIMKNVKAFENNTKRVIEEVINITKTNLDTLNQESQDERKWIVDWAHKRAHLHEDILKTKVMVCARDTWQFGTGPVNYKNGNYMSHNMDRGSDAQGFAIQIYNYTCTDAACAKKILDLQTGDFIVPENASGLYMFTFSVIMDTWDFSLKPSEFYFRKNGHIVEGTRMYSDVGSNQYNDMSMASRTIFLKLEEGDTIDVFQQNPNTDIHDFDVHFCGALIHLAKASKSPGEEHSDFGAPGFPKPVQSELQNATYTCDDFADVVYTDFKYDKKDTKVDETKVDDTKAKIETFKTEGADWESTS